MRYSGIWRVLRMDAIALFFWCALCTLDSAVQWDLRLTNLGGWYAILKVGCLTGFIIWMFRFFIGQPIRWFYALLFVWMSFVLIIEWFVRFYFNITVLGDLWLLIVGSSIDEVKSFLAQFFSIAMLLIVLGVCALVWWGVRQIFKKAYKPVSIKMLLVGVLFVMVAGGTIRPWFESLVSYKIIKDTIRTHALYENLAHIKKNPSIPSNFYAHEITNILGVVVIGESASRNHMHLYGYERDTTPWADSVRNELCVFTNLVASDSMTQYALRNIFTDEQLDSGKMASYTLLQVLKRFGYEINLVSVQGRWGVDGDSYVATIFSDAAREIYVREQVMGVPVYDMMAMPFVWKILNANSSLCQTAMFIHLMGSHCPFQYCFPRDSVIWPENFQQNGSSVVRISEMSKIDAYDNSIRYTDVVLSNVVACVKATGRPSFVLYFSDHGESPSSRAYRDVADLDTWEVPMFVWFSDEYKTLYPKVFDRVVASDGKPIQSDQLTCGILELFRILSLDDTASIFSPRFKIRSPRYINRGMNIYKRDETEE